MASIAPVMECAFRQMMTKSWGGSSAGLSEQRMNHALLTADQEFQVAIRTVEALGHQRAAVTARKTVRVLRRQIGQKLRHVLVNDDFVQIGTGFFRGRGEHRVNEIREAHTHAIGYIHCV